MRIIKKGIIPKNELHGVCNFCKCEIECDKKEATYYSSCRPNDDYYEIKCPTCLQMMYVYPKIFLTTPKVSSIL